MPRVSSYGQRKVGTGALPGVRRTSSAETFESAGGGIAREQVGLQRAKAGVAGAMAGLGQAGVQAGAATLTAVQQVQARERAKANQIAQLTWERQLDELQRALVTDPEHGALTVKGKDTLPLRDTVLAQFKEETGKLAGDLVNDEQRIAFEGAVGDRLGRIGSVLDDHTGKELARFETGEAKALLASTMTMAVAGYKSEQDVGDQIARQGVVIRQHAGALGLEGPEAINGYLSELRSQTWEAVITQTLASGNDVAAKVYFEEAVKGGELQGEARTRMTAAVTKASVDANGERTAADIWTKLGPATDRDPISLDVMEAAARKQLGDDTDTLKATIAALRSRKQGVDDGRRERTDAKNQSIWGAVLEGQPYSAIRRLPAAIDNPEELIKVRDYLQRGVEHEASLAASAESRAAAREGRAYTAEQRKLRQQEIDGWATYQELSDPAKLRTLTRGDVLAQLPTLGPAHVQRLMTDLETVQKSDSTFRSATIDRDVLNEVLSGAGFDYVYDNPSKLTPTQKANVGKVQAAVEDEIARRQVKAGARLSREETRAIAAEVVDAKVMIKDAGWFYQDESQVAAVVNEKDRARAYVPIDQVPKGPADDYANFLRSEMPALAQTPTDAIKAKYGTRLERAYALKLLGAKRAEIEAALRGQ